MCVWYLPLLLVWSPVKAKFPLFLDSVFPHLHHTEELLFWWKMLKQSPEPVKANILHHFWTLLPWRSAPQCFCRFKVNEEIELCLAVASVLSDVSLSSSDVSGSSWGGPALAPLKRTLSDTLGALASTGAPSWPPSTWRTYTHEHTEHFSWADREMNVTILLSEVVRVFFSYNKGRNLTGKST